MRRLNFLPVVFILVATSVAAMSFSSLIKQAEVIKVNAVTAATNTAITVSTTIRGFAANDPYQIKNVDVPKTRFMGHVRANLGSLIKKNAWYAGWAATMLAAGWAIDELTNQVTVPVTTHKGRCTSNYDTVGTGKTVAECNALLASYFAPSYGPVTMTSYYTTQNGTPVYIYDLKINATGQVMKKVGYLQSLTSVSGIPQPVTDDQIYDSMIANMLQDPSKAAQAFMVPDKWPYPYPELFPETIPYIPGVAASDEQALDWYLQGLAQSTDPNGAYYVSPEKLQQIAALAQQLQQAQSPEGQTEALNENLNNPLTQSQLEETLNKRDAANKKEADEISATDKKPITDAFKDSGTKDEFDKLKERVTDPSKLPQLPPLPAVDQIDLPSHTPCRTITMNMFNAVLTFPNPDQCTKLEQVKTGLGYLLYVLTALGIVFELYRRVE
ncbi:hypothetical protein ACSZNE_20970 [Aeromonas caviae]|uniref:hypothetical protein n=1 Tax=Aeromonas caviae TaxID=648 RepID=UPI003EC89851